MISIVACCHGATLCAYAARDFRSQKNGAVTRMWKSFRVQPSHKERAIGVVRLLLVRATFMYGVVLHAHPVRGESHN